GIVSAVDRFQYPGRNLSERGRLGAARDARPPNGQTTAGTLPRADRRQVAGRISDRSAGQGHRPPRRAFAARSTAARDNGDPARLGGRNPRNLTKASDGRSTY